MDGDEEILYELGTYEPRLAKRIIEGLEAEKIAFEVEADNSALEDPIRFLKLYFAMNPEGAKLRIFVGETKIDQATRLVAKLFGDIEP